MQIELAHIGINIEDTSKRKNVIKFFEEMLEMKIHETESNVFINSCIEIMKEKGLGGNGHIAFAVSNLKESIKQLENKGIVFDYQHFKYDENEEISAAYLEGELAGFAVHLIEKER